MVDRLHRPDSPTRPMVEIDFAELERRALAAPLTWIEWGHRCCEKGWNLERTLAEARKILITGQITNEAEEKLDVERSDAK